MTDTLQITTPSDREVRVVRAFKAPRQLIFDCHTKPELIRRWLLGPEGWTMPVCEVDLWVGGAYRYVWRHADGREMAMGGAYKEIAPPERIVTSELFDEDWTDGETIASIVLAEEAGVTTLTQNILYASKAGRDGALASGMTDGMSVGYDRLEEIAAELAQAGA